MLTELVKLPNGYLRIQLTDEGWNERNELRAEFPPEQLEKAHELRQGCLSWEWIDYWIEDALGNGWDLLRPEEIGALTGNENTLLTDTAERDDYGELVSVGTVYYDNYYAVRDPVTELLSEGYVDFWPADEEGSNEAVASGSHAASADAAGNL